MPQSEVWGLEDELQRKCHTANPAAEELVGPQEVRICWYHIPLGGGCGCDTGDAEDVSVAESEVRVIENVENVSLHQQILPLCEISPLAKGQVQHGESWSGNAVPANVGPYSTAGDDISCRGISGQVPDNVFAWVAATGVGVAATRRSADVNDV